MYRLRCSSGVLDRCYCAGNLEPFTTGVSERLLESRHHGMHLLETGATAVLVPVIAEDVTVRRRG